jgi:hypothetical protein
MLTAAFSVYDQQAQRNNTTALELRAELHEHFHSPEVTHALLCGVVAHRLKCY